MRTFVERGFSYVRQTETEEGRSQAARGLGDHPPPCDWGLRIAGLRFLTRERSKLGQSSVSAHEITDVPIAFADGDAGSASGELIENRQARQLEQMTILHRREEPYPVYGLEL